MGKIYFFSKNFIDFPHCFFYSYVKLIDNIRKFLILRKGGVMEKGIKILLILFIAIVMMGFSSDAFAESTADKMFAKLGRGIVNTAFGLVGEIVVKTKEDTKDGNFGGYLTGPIKGVGYGVGRTIIGAYEVLTFLIPLPGDYAQISDPKYAWGE